MLGILAVAFFGSTVCNLLLVLALWRQYKSKAAADSRLVEMDKILGRAINGRSAEDMNLAA